MSDVSIATNTLTDITCDPYGADLSNGSWSTITQPSTVHVADDTEIVFGDGGRVTGRELRYYFKVLRMIIEKDYPEALL